MAMEKIKNAIAKWSGGNNLYKEVTQDGADLTVPDTWHPFPILEEAEFNVSFEMENRMEETGAIAKKLRGNTTVEVKGICQQSDKATLDFFGKDCLDKFFAFYRYEGIVDDNHQEIFIPIVEITPMVNLKSGVKKPPFEMTAHKNDSAITIDTLVLPTGAKTAADVVIPAGEYYLIVETAVV